MRHDIRGFALFIFLIYLQLFALVAMHLMVRVAFVERQIKLGLVDFQLRADALLFLKELDNHRNPNCLRPVYSATFLNLQDLGWWQRNACRDGANYYFMSEVGVDYCAVMQNDLQLNAVQYYLQTVYVGGNHRVLVQDTVAVTSSEKINCTEPVKVIEPGRQTLRWL
jgi:hypothetical protein